HRPRCSTHSIDHRRTHRSTHGIAYHLRGGLMITATMNQQVLHGSLGRPVHILLVEDSPSDVAMTVAALREGHIANDMHVAGDGEEAIEYLFRRAQFRDAQRHDLTPLDLNLPKKDGREVLAQVQADGDPTASPLP